MTSTVWQFVHIVRQCHTLHFLPVPFARLNSPLARSAPHILRTTGLMADSISFVYAFRHVRELYFTFSVICQHANCSHINKTHTIWKGFGGKMQGTRPCSWWKSRTTAGSTGIQGTGPEVGACGTELWIWCRLYAPRLTFPVAAFNKVTNGSPALCTIRYCPSSNLENQMKSQRAC